MKKVVVIYLFLMLVPFIGKAQLSIDPIITSQNFTQDTVPLGTVVNFNVKVLYTDVTPFTGTIYLISGVDSSAGITSVDTVGFTSVFNLSNDSLNIPLAKFAKLDIKTYTIGIGTSRGGVISIRVPEENNPNQLEPPRQIQSKLDMKALDLIKQKTGGKSYVVNNSSSQVQSFLISALAENRKPTLTLVPTGEAENFWWDFLAIPSLVIVSLMAIKFIRS